MITFAPVRIDQDMLPRYEALFRACFPSSNKFSPQVLKWLYEDNPEGKAVGFDALEGGRPVAHYVCVPTKIRIDGAVVSSLLSLNTATHPQYQGRGLFSKLAALTYQAAADRGFSCVYGVANSNSTPGFVRKLGFQLVQPLEAKIGVGNLGINFEHLLQNAQFERIWTPDSLKWRCSSPVNPVTAFDLADCRGFYARALGRALPAYTELTHAASSYVENIRPVTPLRLYLGLVPKGSGKFSAYADIPTVLRPSPLNLIFRPLASHMPMLEADHIHFSFLDFDAY